jgi:ribulose 1,5-bisphosphate carboxylase large subunit-like protein
MPPKKDVKKPGMPNAIADEDLTDVQSLPVLHDFVFTNLYCFKYRKNLKLLETSLLKEFLPDPEKPETAELGKKKKVIQQSDLIN